MTAPSIDIARLQKYNTTTSEIRHRGYHKIAQAKDKLGSTCGESFDPSAGLSPSESNASVARLVESPSETGQAGKLRRSLANQLADCFHNIYFNQVNERQFKLRYMVQRGLYLASLSFPTIAFTAIINRLANHEVYSTLVAPSKSLTTTSNLTLSEVDSAFIFGLVFWVSVLVIALAESILVIVTFKLINAHTRNQDGPGNNSVVEFLWTIIPPLFTISLAIASKDHLRISATQDLVEVVLLGCGVLLLVISTGILLLRSFKDLRVEQKTGILPFYTEIQEQNIHINFEGADETIYSARAPSLAIEPEASHRGKL